MILLLNSLRCATNYPSDFIRASVPACAPCRSIKSHGRPPQKAYDQVEVMRHDDLAGGLAGRLYNTWLALHAARLPNVYTATLLDGNPDCLVASQLTPMKQSSSVNKTSTMSR